MLILGGTGIVGTATAKEAVKEGLHVSVTGIDTRFGIPEGVHFVHHDNLDLLSAQEWDVVFDIFCFDVKQARKTSALKSKHTFVLSTTLVYDRSRYSFDRISSNHPLCDLGFQGGYVDKKLEIEDFWGKNNGNWTILRPYHILGPGSFLGCLPPHNRDPDLLRKIEQNDSIELCDGGRIPLNIVHPKDIGKVVLNAMGNPETFRKAYNVVNPTEVIARDYYLKIAELLGTKLTIKNKSGENVWFDGKWVLTSLPHLYDIGDLSQGSGYVPNMELEECLRDAIACHPKKPEGKIPIHQRMHYLPPPLRNRYF